MKRLLVLVVLLGVFFVWKTRPTRFAVVMVTSPVRVWVWDKERGGGVVISIPDDTRIPTVYGTYPVSSVWKLGELDRKDELLLARSLSEVLGIPIKWYIGPNRTNVPFPLLFHIRMTSQKGKIIDASSALREVVLPDGSTQQELDESKFERILGNAFEVKKVREEALPIAVYNTTKTPALGTRMGRMITHLGGNVLVVGNSTQVVSDTCLITGKKETVKMYTAVFLAKELGCSRHVARMEDERVELSVYVTPRSPLLR